MSYKLIVDRPRFEALEYVVEEKNGKQGPELFVQGVYAEADKTNKNHREYPLDEMKREIGRYVKEMVEPGRALGELNHPSTAEVDLERASHMIVDIKQEGNQFIGKSKVLSTPCGRIAANLIQDGAALGMSTRAVGRLTENDSGVNIVSDMSLIAVDMVADPSCPSAFVNGILESKNYILADHGGYEEAYNNFELGLRDIPKKDLETYLQEQIVSFFQKIAERQ